MVSLIRRNCNCFRRRESTSTIEGYDESSSSDIDIPQIKGIKAPPRRPRLGYVFLHRHFSRVINRFRHRQSMGRLERTVKATLLIQRWFRRYMARLELRRRYTWNIFQSLEYAGEQDQVKLYNFFNALLTHIPTTNRENGSTITSRASSMEEYDLFTFEDESENDDELQMTERDRKYELKFPLTEDTMKALMDLYKANRHYRLHAKHVAEVLKRSIASLKKLPNLNKASTGITQEITVCGDLHGKLDDLLTIFQKNGLPSIENPYVFNGDFVDRGRRGIEIFIILLCFQLMYPDQVFLNRGNHEDFIMNARYGFSREVLSKYKRNSEKLLKLIEEVYRWLPLGTIVNSRVFIVHGGISDTTDLDMISCIDRGRFLSLLRPPLSENPIPGFEAMDKEEWKQVFDILWSDPQTTTGCVANTLRGAGTYFGPDVTKAFLKTNRFDYLIRSHECKVGGYEVTHDGKVITIFSASNYYEIGSNKGAYLTLNGPTMKPHFVQFISPTGKAKSLNFYQRMSVNEAAAVREIHGLILKSQNHLESEFEKLDSDHTGYVSTSDWCKAMESAIGLELPWRMLKEKLVDIDRDNQLVKYSTTFENIDHAKVNPIQGTATVLETLYKNKSSLETIFRIIDKDNSGYITTDEFLETYNLLKEHISFPMTPEQSLEICHLMDLNKDGSVDLNEFLESFRMVDLDYSKSKFENQTNGSNVDVTKSTTTQNNLKVQNSPSSAKDKVESRKSSITRQPTVLSVSSITNNVEERQENKSKVTLSITVDNHIEESISPKSLIVKDTSENLSSSVKSLNSINIKISDEINERDQLTLNSTTENKNRSSLDSNLDRKIVLSKSPVLSIRRGSQI